MPIQEWSDSIWIVTLGEEPDLSEDLHHVRNKAADAAAMPSLVLDLSGVSQINSSNLSQLLRVRKLASDREGRVRLVGLRDGVWAVFMVTGLDKVFEFNNDVTTALASLQM